MDEHRDAKAEDRKESAAQAEEGTGDQAGAGAGVRDDAQGTEACSENGQPKDLDVGAYVESFSALKDSVFQGHDLRKQQRELEAYARKTQDLAKEHADRVHILENYDAVVGEQEETLQRAQGIIDVDRPELERASAAQAAAQGKLDAMKSEHKSELSRLKKKNDKSIDGREKAAADAKAARKAAEDRYRAAAQTKEGVGSAQTAQLKQALDEAKAREREAGDALKDAKAQAKQMYRDKKQACDDAERPVQDELSKCKAQVQKIRAEIDAGEKEASAAQERIEYCREVKRNPAATDELAAKIAERKEVARQMSGRIETLSEQHAQSKEGSKKARLVVVVALVLIVAIVVAIIVTASR